MKKLMKVVLKLNKTAFTNITMALSIAILSSGCGGATTNNTIEAGGDESSPTDATVLFVDKSSSLQDSVALLAIQTPLLRQVIGATDEPGDAFYGYYIHGNTLSGKHFFSKVLAWEVPNLEGLGGPSRQKRIDAMNSERRKQQGQILKEIKAALLERNENSTNRETDIWASLEVASRSFMSMPADTRKAIIFVSDLEESVRGEHRRDFTKKAPGNKAEAEEWAQVDLDWINANLDVKPEQLSGVKVTVYLPRDAHTSSDFQQVRYYWEALFAHWGMELVAVN